MLRDDDEKLHNSYIFMTLLTSSFCSQTTWEVIQASRRAHVSLAINKIDEVPVDVVCGVFYCEYMEKVDDGEVDDKKCLHDNKNPFKALSRLFFYFVSSLFHMNARKLLWGSYQNKKLGNSDMFMNESGDLIERPLLYLKICFRVELWNHEKEIKSNEVCHKLITI